MTYEELTDRIYEWSERHRTAIAITAAIIGTICFMLEATNALN